MEEKELNFYQPEKVYAKMLLNAIYSWRDKYIAKLKIKNPNISEEQIKQKVQNATARKFKNDFLKVTKIKIFSLIQAKLTGDKR